MSNCQILFVLSELEMPPCRYDTRTGSRGARPRRSQEWITADKRHNVADFSMPFGKCNTCTNDKQTTVSICSVAGRNEANGRGTTTDSATQRCVVTLGHMMVSMAGLVGRINGGLLQTQSWPTRWKMRPYGGDPGVVFDKVVCLTLCVMVSERVTTQSQQVGQWQRKTFLSRSPAMQARLDAGR